jgi:hypothetical protein
MLNKTFNLLHDHTVDNCHFGWRWKQKSSCKKDNFCKFKELVGWWFFFTCYCFINNRKIGNLYFVVFGKLRVVISLIFSLILIVIYWNSGRSVPKSIRPQVDPALNYKSIWHHLKLNTFELKLFIISKCF